MLGLTPPPMMEKVFLIFLGIRPLFENMLKNSYFTPWNAKTLRKIISKWEKLTKNLEVWWFLTLEVANFQSKTRDMDKMVRGQKVTQNTFDKMGRRLPDALGD